MRTAAALRRAVRNRLEQGARDAGTTMMEMVVGMAVMAIFMTMFTTAVMQMTRTANTVSAVTESAGQVNQAFLRLDKLVRYSSAVTTAGQASSGMWYVELDNTASGLETCTQLRVNTTYATPRLEERAWTVDGSTVTDTLGWTMLANGVTNGSAAPGPDQPFLTTQSGNSSPFQQLRLVIVVRSTGAAKATTRSSMTFTAVNSVVAASTNSSRCQQKGRT